MNILESLNKGFESKYSMSSSRRPVARKPLHEAKSTKSKDVELSNVKGTVGKVIKDNIEKINRSTSKESLIKIMNGLLKDTNGKGKEDFLAELSKTSNYGAAMEYVYNYMLKGDNLGVNRGKKLNERKNKRCPVRESVDTRGNALVKVKKYLKSQGIDMEESLGADVAKYQKWVDYDMKRYGKISDTTSEKIRKAGLSVVKDQYGDYEVIAKDPVEESKKGEKGCHRGTGCRTGEVSRLTEANKGTSSGRLYKKLHRLIANDEEAVSRFEDVFSEGAEDIDEYIENADGDVEKALHDMADEFEVYVREFIGEILDDSFNTASDFAEFAASMQACATVFKAFDELINTL